ncbi:MAG TPA: hydrogenase maturation nickel metallochaperone HypA [Pseudonocardia sp.]|jgi:hydrogenase nickel incorporation protein HypA/HybF|uniref:hydrogenase maturation nickel metallochaperone HypA/HybF n=1 Tax=Pseudonocardia sp. TaxID=60912 RepID=UPI002B4B7FFE|nr:hydrogenase maturation nickel metallochaperone HypA [Pseudonocardia sp.]HLU57732.1 hydrogenase maturation nickel metallochaperone HypA [Pseudonocardia sp.]
MHELSITRSVVDAVTEHAGGSAVRSLTLEIGRLSGVLPDAVRFCFELCAAGTPCEGAQLVIVDTPGRARCRDCAADVELPDQIPLCPCGSANLEITGGQQLKIRQLEIGD